MHQVGVNGASLTDIRCVETRLGRVVAYIAEGYSELPPFQQFAACGEVQMLETWIAEAKRIRQETAATVARISQQQARRAANSAAERRKKKQAKEEELFQRMLAERGLVAHKKPAPAVEEYQRNLEL